MDNVRAMRGGRNRRSTAAAVLVLLLTSTTWWGPVPVAQATCGTAGSVTFDPAEVVSSNATASVKTALIGAITGSWRRYLAMDVAGYKVFLAADATKMSGRWGASGVQQGADVIAAGLPTEWTAYEHPTGVIAEAFTIRRAVFNVDQQTATARYWVAVRGGARWCYTDLGLVFQAWVKTGSTWRLAHQTDSWNLSYNYLRNRPGRQTFPFDFVTPVKDMARQVAFYEHFAGPPEYVTATRASFQLKGAHFLLDAGGLQGMAGVTAGLPNGYAVFYVADVVAERARLLTAGVPFAAGTATTLLSDGPDRYAIALDPSGNPFVVMQRNYTTDASGAPVEPMGFTGSDPRILAAKSIASAWLRADGAGLQSLYGTAGRWFDDTRTRIRGLEAGNTLATVLPAEYWSRFDRGPGGLQAQMTVSSVLVRPLGSGAAVSYRTDLTGTGAHPFHDTAFVTHVLDAQNRPVLSMTVGAEEHAGAALSLDYSGYPVSNLTASADFYQYVMRLGRAYPDSGYRGWWSDSGVVFGIYIAKPSRDRLPRPGMASGYMSFWITSAEDTYAWLQAQGATFPRIPAINTRAGIDPQPGYTQVVATDPDGNLQVFTEYTGL